MTGDRKPMVQIATRWEREVKTGRKYFSGFMGDAQLLLFQSEQITHNGETIQTWRLLVQEREWPRSEKPTPESRPDLPTRGQSMWNAGPDHEDLR